MFASKLFWGALVIIAGILIILGGVFKINIPIFRTLFALFIIYIGVRMLMGSFGGSWKSRGDNADVFSSSQYRVTNADLGKEYNAVFGSQKIDLSGLTLDQDASIEFNAVFGSIEIRVPANLNLRVKGSAVFGSTQFPNGTQAVFGDQTFSTEQGSGPRLDVEANAVFGSVRFVN